MMRRLLSSAYARSVSKLSALAFVVLRTWLLLADPLAQVAFLAGRNSEKPLIDPESERREPRTTHISHSLPDTYANRNTIQMSSLPIAADSVNCRIQKSPSMADSVTSSTSTSMSSICLGTTNTNVQTQTVLFAVPRSELLDDSSDVATYFLPFALSYLPKMARQDFFDLRNVAAAFEFSVGQDDASIHRGIFVVKNGFLFELGSSKNPAASKFSRTELDAIGVIALKDIKLKKRKNSRADDSGNVKLQLVLNSRSMKSGIKDNMLRRQHSLKSSPRPIAANDSEVNKINTSNRTSAFEFKSYSFDDRPSVSSNPESETIDSETGNSGATESFGLNSKKITLQGSFDDVARFLRLVHDSKVKLFPANVDSSSSQVSSVESVSSAGADLRIFQARFEVNMSDPCSLLGKGSFTTVFKAVNKESGSPCAVKVIHKRALWELMLAGKERRDTITHEIAFNLYLKYAEAKMPSLRVSDFIVSAKSFSDSSCSLIMEMELMQSMDLFQYLINKTKVSESEAKQIMKPLARAVTILKDLGIAHRDLKLSNVVFSSLDPRRITPKIIDFGLALFEDEQGMITGRCGTPGFIAPEVLSSRTGDSYYNNVDTFALGVIMFTLLTGCEPFRGKTERELLLANKRCELKYQFVFLENNASPEAADLVKQLMERDPELRMEAHDILHHPWFDSDYINADDFSPKSPKSSPTNGVENTEPRVNEFTEGDFQHGNPTSVSGREEPVEQGSCVAF